MENVIEKCRGVIGRVELLHSGAVLIPSCNWVHSFFVSEPLHVFFLSADYSHILHDEQVNPNRLSQPYPDSAHVLETLVTFPKNTVDEV
jgi:hypothetical protein